MIQDTQQGKVLHSMIILRDVVVVLGIIHRSVIFWKLQAMVQAPDVRLISKSVIYFDFFSSFFNSKTNGFPLQMSLISQLAFFSVALQKWLDYTIVFGCSFLPLVIANPIIIRQYTRTNVYNLLILNDIVINYKNIHKKLFLNSCLGQDLLSYLNNKFAFLNSQIYNQSEMSIDFSPSFSIRPDTPRVADIRVLSEFIEEYPDEELTPNLLLLGQKYKYYRPICGDGNCFYRACMFLYFSTARLDKKEDVLPYAPIKNCINLPFEFDDYDVDQLFNFIWSEYLQPMRTMDQYQRQKEMVKKLNSSLMLDAFLIAYFRSLNHQYLTTHRQKFLSFIEGNVERQLQQVLNFGRQSQGIELFAMAELLKVRISIMMVHKANFQQIVYMQEGRQNFVLFFRPGHYDILCDDMEFRSQGSGIRSNSNLKSSLGNSSNNRRHIEPKVVKINSIEDYGKAKAHLSEPMLKRVYNEPKNVSNFYQKVKSEINPQQASIKRINDSNGKRQNRHSSSPQKFETNRLNQIKKNEFKPAQMIIPNISKNKVYLEAVIIVASLALIFGLPFLT